MKDQTLDSQIVERNPLIAKLLALLSPSETLMFEVGLGVRRKRDRGELPRGRVEFRRAELLDAGDQFGGWSWPLNPDELGTQVARSLWSDCEPQKRKEISGVEELARVHRAEISRLFRVAAEWRLGEAADYAWVEFEQLGSWENWRREVVFECVLALLDGLEGEAVAELAKLVLRSRECWPTASALAEASLLYSDCEEGRLMLVRTRLTSAKPRSALTVLAAAMRRGVSKDNRWRLYTGLGRAHELCGGDRLALSAFQVAGESRAPNPTPYLDGFFTALALGKSGVAELLAQRLDAGEFPEADVIRVGRALKARWMHRAAPLPWQPSDISASRLFRRMCARDASPLASVCRDLSAAEVR